MFRFYNRLPDVYRLVPLKNKPPRAICVWRFSYLYCYNIGMLEGFILGAVQGITEWLPISSEGALVLTQQALGSALPLGDMIRVALFLHLGTFFAALFYFWNDVTVLLRALFKPVSASPEEKKTVWFLVIATAVSGVLGALILVGISREFETIASASGAVVTLFVGALLLVTAFLQFRAGKGGDKSVAALEKKDGIILGLAQGLSALPGISRSGITIAALLLNKFSKQVALRLSFLMSLPIVFFGNIVLGFGDAALTAGALWGLLFSFLFGLVTIKGLFAFAERVNFGWFVFVFGLLTIFAALSTV